MGTSPTDVVSSAFCIARLGFRRSAVKPVGFTKQRWLTNTRPRLRRVENALLHRKGCRQAVC